MLKLVLGDRRLWLMAVLTAAVLVTTRVVVPVNTGFVWVVNAGYWFTLVLVVLFGRAIAAVICERWKTAGMGRFEVVVAAAIMAVSALWCAHEKPGYKILADELLLSGTAMGMHYERKAAAPTRATDVRAAFEVLERVLDKRPLLYPFVVATAHDLTGYRPQNAFYVNIVLGAVFLWVMYLVGWNAGGSRWAGVVAGLLFAGLPLLAQQATGGGFELLNLLLLAVFVLLAVYYLESPEKARLEAFVFGALLLASARYESLFFLAPLAMVALAGWWRSKQVVLTWPLIASPLFLAILMLQNRFFSGGETAWQLQSRPDADAPFALEYLNNNLGHALAFFFDCSGYQPNAVVFGALGLAALPVFLLWMIGVVRAPATTTGAQWGWVLSGLSLMGITGVYMVYFWGQFDDPIIHRLSLPTHLFFALAVVLAGSMFLKTARGWQVLALIVVAGWLVQGLPVLARQAYRTNYSPGVEMQIRSAFLQDLSDRNVLFIDNDSYFWILHKIPASPVKKVVSVKEGLAFHLRNHSFQGIYVFQSVLVNPETGAQAIDPDDDLGPDFELVTVREKRVQSLLFARISRVTAIKSAEAVLAREASFVEVREQTLTEDEVQKNRALYMENWIKQLP